MEIVMIRVIVVAAAALFIYGAYSDHRSDERELAKRMADAATERQAAMTPEQRAAEQQRAARVAAAKAKADRLDDASFVCEEMVRRSLNDPESAVFDPYKNFPASEISPGVYSVRVGVRARNGFGGMTRSTFNCTTALVGGNWMHRGLDEV